MLDKPIGTDDDEVANCSDDDLSNVDESCNITATVTKKSNNNAKDEDESSDGDIDEGLNNVAPTTSPTQNKESKRPPAAFSINLAKA